MDCAIGVCNQETLTYITACRFSCRHYFYDAFVKNHGRIFYDFILINKK